MAPLGKNLATSIWEKKNVHWPHMKISGPLLAPLAQNLETFVDFHIVTMTQMLWPKKWATKALPQVDLNTLQFSRHLQQIKVEVFQSKKINFKMLENVYQTKTEDFIDVNMHGYSNIHKFLFCLERLILY